MHGDRRSNPRKERMRVRIGQLSTNTVDDRKKLLARARLYIP
jgi:hypothetical protein